MIKINYSSCKFPAALTTAALICLVTLLLMSSDAIAQIPTEIAIEIDYMVLRDSLGEIVFSHQPQPDEIAAVEQMFACRGINCLILVDDEIPYIEVLQRSPDDPANFFGYNGPNSFGLIKQNYRDYGQCWHYCIFGHRYQRTDFTASGSSGLAELCGDDFIVTLGDFNDSVGTPFDRASTLAHELGHNLGLNHANSMDEDLTGPDTPNYPSTMSYFCQLSGVRSRYIEMGLAQTAANLLKEIDYSYGDMCTINEAALDERFGIGMKKLDWDCDGTIEAGTVAEDLDRDSLGQWCITDGALSVLNDYYDWAVIRDYACLKSPQELENVPTISCISYEEHQQFIAGQRSFRQPPIEVEPCINNRMRFVVPGYSTEDNGKCLYPHVGVTNAHLFANPGDILFLKYGTYDEPGASLLLNKRMVITATSNALIRPVGKDKEEE